MELQRLLLWVYPVAMYFVGAIPTGYLLAKKLRGIDIREHGSGNVGATNVRRVVGAKAGSMTMAIDFLKGFFPVLGAVLLISPESDPWGVIPIFTAITVVVGHSKSIYIGFSGGKSVITSLGAMLVLEPVVSVVIAITAFTVIKLTRYVSVGSLLGALLFPLLVWGFNRPLSHLVLACIICVYVTIMHRQNIHRLLHHQENRL